MENFFDKIFNIVFVSVCAALLLLFLISVIVVAAKGKRKCGAFDIVLRVVASVVMVVSAAMVACSVLTMTKGSVAIVVAEDGSVAALVMNKSITELPMPALFAALSTVIGFGLSAVLFILSLTALIVDCLVANKKTGEKGKKDKKQPAVKKSPEQLKREAELERIRRIGESAVRKTERVAEKAEKAEKPENAENQAAEDSIPTEQPQDDEPVTDWRTQPAEEQHSFVGLKDDTADDSFDSFDTFDDEQPADGGADNYDQEDVEEEAAEQSDEYVTEVGDEYAEDNGDEYAEDNGDEYAEEQTETDEQPTEDIYYDADEQYTYDEGAEGDEQVEDELADGEDNYEYDQTSDEQTVDEFDEVEGENNEDYEADEGVEADDTDAAPQAGELSASDIEPDRGIYIPEIRTVTPRPTEVKTSAVKKPAARPTTQRAAAKSSRTAKPKKSGSGGASQRPSVIPPEKKLPVTRRYVILDRHNAVNMFGEYLKERNQAEKDKLKSSINTIIIE